MKYFIRLVTLCLLIVCYSCKQSINAEDIKELNGYWEIEKAKLSNGEEKDYSINSSIDYFQLDSNSTGFRQKVMPQFNGEYLTNNIQENLLVEYQRDGVFLHYKTEYAEWKEQVIKLSKDELVVKNENDIMYYYKRPVAFSLK